MGTRSDIIVQRADGKWHRIYCHWDGYLSHNGRILFDHYTSQPQAEKLVKLGDLSILAPKCTKPKGHTFTNAVKGYCVAYGRDRGDKDTAGTIGDTLSEVWPEQDCWTEFTYVWTEGQWFVADPDTGSQALVNLGDALSGKIKLQPSVKVFGAPMGQHAAHDPAKPDNHSWHRAK